MKILFNDKIQNTDAPIELKKPALSDIYKLNETLIINFDSIEKINSIGIGNTDGTYFNINGEVITFTENGLYIIKEIQTDTLEITTDATFIGRIGAGIACNIPIVIAKEPGFNSTAEPRITLSGQVVEGAGGYNYKTISLDSRYKINELIMNEIKNGYKYIGLGYPFFIDLSVESYKLPFNKLYATERNQNQLIFQSGVKKYLYSYRFEFEERF
ncbi:MAG: hypothetical protein FWH54_05900 [Methanobrevibacter sp.]|nr:hypothetical protein [Methanobrevibacter sp.]